MSHDSAFFGSSRSRVYHLLPGVSKIRKMASPLALSPPLYINPSVKVAFRAFASFRGYLGPNALCSGKGGDHERAWTTKSTKGTKRTKRMVARCGHPSVPSSPQFPLGIPPIPIGHHPNSHWASSQFPLGIIPIPIGHHPISDSIQGLTIVPFWPILFCASTSEVTLFVVEPIGSCTQETMGRRGQDDT